jgi:glycosyltransferase involved in cell wall biosynthesis
MGQNVSIVTPVPDDPNGNLYSEFSNNWVEADRVDDVDVMRLKSFNSGNKLRTLRDWIKYVWFGITSLTFSLCHLRPDVIIGTSPHLFTPLSGWCIAKLLNVPFVFEIRDLYPENYRATNSKPSWVIYYMLDLIAKFLYSFSSLIVVVTPGMKDSLVDMGVDPDRVVIHTNGLNPDFYDIKTGFGKSVLENFSDKFVVIYVGSIEREHGLRIILDTAEILTEDREYGQVIFLIIGAGSRYDSLKSEAKNRKIENVKFLGHMPKKKVPKYLAAANAALVHLKRDPLFELALPSKIFEAMGAGLPILIGMKGDAAKLVDDAEAGFIFEPENPDSLASVIKLAHDNPDLLMQKSKNSAETGRQKFDWQTIAEGYLQDLHGLMSEN